MQCWGDAMAKNPYGYPEFIKSTGYGTGAGLKGWNCYHDFHPFIPGVDTPNYTEEEVAQMNAEENIKHKFGDKEYTAYEATQRQRELERVMRKYGEETHLLELGGADDDTVLATKVRYQTASQEYAAFSKAMGLPQQRERIRNGMDSLAQYAQTEQKALDISARSDIIEAEEPRLLFLNDLDDFSAWQDAYYQYNSGASFTREDNPSIFAYTGGSYEAINAVLRGGNRLEKTKKHYGSSFDTEKYKKIADGISKELSKFKLNETLELKRSVGNVDFITGSTSSVDDMIASIGKVYVERGFTSATVCGDTTLPFGGISDTRTTLEIVADARYTIGAYIYKMSEHPAEFEFLINKNTAYKVLDAGVREIEVKDFRGNIRKEKERFMRLQVIRNDRKSV